VREYDIFVPLYYNDGSAVEARKFQNLQKRLLEHFDGLTFFPQPNQGFWKMGGLTYRDEIVIYRVLTGNVRAARRLLRQIKVELKKSFRQVDILIVGRNVEVI
jgi:hypothetical protein